jgi:hypothetical protein
MIWILLIWYVLGYVSCMIISIFIEKELYIVELFIFLVMASVGPAIFIFYFLLDIDGQVILKNFMNHALIKK